MVQQGGQWAVIVQGGGEYNPSHLTPPRKDGGWVGGRLTGSSERSAGGLMFQFRHEMIN